VTGACYWLLDLEFAGQVVRVSTADLDVLSTELGELHYTGALQEMTFSEALELLDSQLTQANVQVSAVLPVNVPALIALGHRLEGATGTLALWREGQTYEERRVRMIGRVSDPEYGAEWEETSFTLQDELWQSDIEIPAPGAEVSASTWPDSLQNTYFAGWSGTLPDFYSSLRPEDMNLVYPVVFGRPGRTQGLSDPAWEGSIAVHISRDRGPSGAAADPGPVIVIAGHRVNADTVYLFTESIQNQTWNYYKGAFSALDPQDNGFLVEHWTDARGRTVAVCPGVARGDTAGSAAVAVNGVNVCTLGSNYMNIELDDDSYRTYSDENGGLLYVPLYVGWYDRTRSDEGGGMVGDDGQLVRGAGDVLTYLLRETGMQVDAGRCATASALLNAFKIDCAIDARTPIWEWLSANLLPILPVSLATGPEGLFPIVWRYDATVREAQWIIDADNDPTTQRASRVTIDSSKIANSFRIDFCKNRRTSEVMQYRGLTATYDSTDPSVRASYLCAVSVARYKTPRDPGIREKRIETSIIWDVPTADAILDVQARAYALARRTVDYVVSGAQWDAVSRGDVVAISDSEIGLSDQVALVREVQWDTSGSIGLSLLLIEDPARDNL
jgi:hypothetical protein